VLPPGACACLGLATAASGLLQRWLRGCRAPTQVLRAVDLQSGGWRRARQACMGAAWACHASVRLQREVLRVGQMHSQLLGLGAGEVACQLGTVQLGVVWPLMYAAVYRDVTGRVHAAPARMNCFGGTE